VKVCFRARGRTRKECTILLGRWDLGDKNEAVWRGCLGVAFITIRGYVRKEGKITPGGG